MLQRPIFPCLIQFLVILLVVVCCVIGTQSVAFAESITYAVDRTDDVNPPAQSCNAATPNDCSLRGAILAANAHAGQDTVQLLCGNSYVLNISPTGSNNATTGDLNITDGMSITVKGSLACILNNMASVRGDANFTDRIFQIENGAQVAINSLNIRDGKRNSQPAQGGGIYVAATSGLTLTFSNVISNSASDAGGGIYNLGDLTVQSSAVISSSAVQGAGIYNNGSLTLVNSTLSGNKATGQGGGIYHQNGTTHAWNVTIASNIGNAGGIHNAGAAGQVQLANTIVANNRLPTPDASNCLGNITSAGYNLIQKDKDCLIVAQTGDLLSLYQNANLVALTAQIGGALVHPLHYDSVAIDAGNPAGCVDGQGKLSQKDQRATARPSAEACDMGAYEWNGPRVTSISPNKVLAGSPATKLTLTGFNFVEGSIVEVASGLPQPTTFISSTQLTALVAESLFQGGHVGYGVTVVNPDGQFVYAGSLNVLPHAVLDTLSPASAVVGSGVLSLTLNGANFAEGAVVRWNDSARPTQLVSSTQLVAVIGATDLASEGMAKVRVLNVAPNGKTKELTFVIQPAGSNSIPTLFKLSPSQIEAGSEGVTLQFHGDHFINGAVVDWAGNLRAVTFINSTRLALPLLASDLAQPGYLNVAVINPGPGGGKSNAKPFSVDVLRPVLTSLSPTLVAVNSPGFLLDLYGKNFESDMVAEFGYSQLVTIFIDSTHLRADIPTTYLTNAGTVNIEVASPDPFNKSNRLKLVISDPAKQAQTIHFAPLPDLPLSAGSTLLSATASSLLTVTFDAVTPTTCIEQNNQLTLHSYGVCSLVAHQFGNEQFNAAPSVVRHFTITQQSKQTQNISFPTLPDRELSDGPFALNATASSGLVVSFHSETPIVCTVSGMQVTLLTLGQCTLAATQPGDESFAPAVTVQRSFHVLASPLPTQISVYLPLVTRE